MYLRSPINAVNLRYRCRLVAPGEVIDVREIDVDALTNEGWAEPEKAKPKTAKKKTKIFADDGEV